MLFADSVHHNIVLDLNYPFEAMEDISHRIVAFPRGGRCAHDEDLETVDTVFPVELEQISGLRV